MAYRDTILLDNPSSYYEMETSTGTDTKGARTLTLAGGITTGVDGHMGKGWSFDGVNDSASASTFPSTTTALSLEAWVRSPTNGGWSNDYQTFVRRDGTDVVLIRGRGSNISGGVQPGKAEVFIAGSTIYSTNRIDDGQWHHVVLTVAGTAARLYVDGTLSGSVTTSKSTYSFGTGAFYVGSATGTGEFYKGSMDDVAIYPATLNATQVQSHYASGAPTPGGYTGQVMEASASFPGGFHPVPRTVTGEPLVASGNLSEAVQRTKALQTQTGAYSFDDSANVSISPLIIDKGDPGFSTNRVVIPIDTPLVNATASSATIALKTDKASNPSFRIYPVYSTVAGQVTDESKMILGTPLTFTPSATNATVDKYTVTSMFNGRTVYGFLLKWANESDAPVRFANSFQTGSNAFDNRPVLEASYYTITQSAAVAAQPLVADAQVVSGVFGVGATTQGQVLETAVSMPSALVVGERFVTHNAEPLEAFLEAPEGLFASPVSPSVPVLSADAQMPDAVVGTAQGVVFEASTIQLKAEVFRPALVNGQVIVMDETEDKYFRRVMALAPTYFTRLNDNGRVVKNRITGQEVGKYLEVQTGKFDAPEGRHSVHFPAGSAIEQTEPDGTNIDESTLVGDTGVVATTVEFAVRTTRANTFLMVSKDNVVSANGVVSTGNTATEIGLSNGKLVYTEHSTRTATGSRAVINSSTVIATGFTDVADGRWHTVVVRSGAKSAFRDEYGIEVWVDGKFEFRKFGATSFIGYPDWIGSRPTNIDGVNAPALPLSRSFEGDMSEIVFYPHEVSTTNISRNFYAFMGYNPIEAEPMEATAKLVEGRGKGSQKKALYLYWSDRDEVFGGAPGGPGDDSESYDPNPGLAAGSYSASIDPSIVTQAEMAGLRVEARSVVTNVGYNAPGGPYRDRYTDEQSLIDLKTDIDLDEYDVIMFKDWPDEGYELDRYEAIYPGQKTRLVNQLRDANDKGVGLYITNPRMAVDLGVVDRIERVQTLRENRFSDSQGAAAGLYDYGSALKFPWDIINSDGLTGGTFALGTGQPQNLSAAVLANKAFFYHDTNHNNRFRVRALIEGLTDLPSFMVSEAVWHVDYDRYGWQGAAYKYLERENGLRIGDEYIFYGSEEINAKYLDIVERRYNRFNGTWATPPGHVKAGTVVTTYGSKHWVGTSQVDNPYRDYATTIVLRPGDTLAGRPVGGRIFVNFTEQPTAGLAVAVQQVPTNASDLPQGYPAETAAQREWGYSWTRTTLRTTSEQAARSVSVQLPDGSLASVRLGGNDETLSQVRSNHLFKSIGKPRLEMTARGLYWLAAAERAEEGEVVVRASAMDAQASLPEPKVVAQKKATVTGQSLVATASMPRVKEDTFGDVVVVALPMTVDATFTGFGRTVSAETMQATAALVEIFDAVHAEGEQVALILHNYAAQVFLKEEA